MSKVFWLAIPLSFAALAVACTTEKVLVQPPSQAQGISVSGTGDASGSPDLAILDLGVSAEASSVGEARSTAASAMDAVLGKLKDDGVAEKDIQTTQFRIEPQYEYPDGKQVLRGFRVTNIVEAKVRDLDRVGEVVDDAAGAGGDIVQVQSLSFTIEQPDTLRAQARQKAVADARSRAEDLAHQADVNLGKPLSITESTAVPPTPVLMKALPSEAAGQPATPIEPGELQVSVTVDVIFAIE